MEKSFVLSVGGSLISPPEGIDTAFLKKFRQFVVDRIKRGYRFYLVVGGGAVCRRYNKAASVITKVKPLDLDWMGISATRLNAHLLKAIFGNLAHDEIIADPTKKIKTNKKIVIAAGYKPGWSTDYDAVLIAKNNGAKMVINLSNIDYAYNKDPRRFPEAKKLKNVSWPVFQKIVGRKWRPGLNVPFDPIASLEASKNKMRVVIINGSKLENLGNCLEGTNFRGTNIGF